VAWHVFQEEERRRVRGIHEGLDKDCSSTIRIYLPNEPGTFKFVEPQVFGDVEFAAQPKREEGAVDYCMGGEKKEDSCKELDEIRSVVKQLDNKLHLLVVSVRSNQVGIMNHLWGSINHLGSALDALHGRVYGVEQDVGNSAEVLDEYNLVDLSEGLMRALGQVAPMASSNPQFENLQEKIVYLTRLNALVDEYHQKAGGYLLGKLWVITPPQSQTGGGVGVPSGNTLLLATPIVDDAGAKVGTFGQLLKGFDDLAQENTLFASNWRPCWPTSRRRVVWCWRDLASCQWLVPRTWC
jgi:hypothetical protein